ncbi:MAG: hypothetical protein HRU19_27850 [Pseudobacteriovorax sp.]|nr:hypothetical protein [Pseudobacteriovorax sp.]
MVKLTKPSLTRMTLIVAVLLSGCSSSSSDSNNDEGNQNPSTNPNDTGGQTELNDNEGVAENLLRIIKVPSNTPSDASLYLAGTLNNWSPAHVDYQLKRADDGSYSILLDEDILTKGFQYKFTRGTWDTVEKDADGKELEDRVYLPGRDIVLTDLEIASWADLTPPPRTKYRNR